MNPYAYAMNWTPSIGDPSVMGWLTVFAYLIAAVFAYRVYLKSHLIFRRHWRERQQRLWLIIAIILAALCVNKQLDLQTLLTDIGRYIFLAFGFYEFRRIFQVLFIGLVFFGGLVVVLKMFLIYRDVLRHHYLAISGLCLLMVFVIIRAASFHLVDTLINYRILGLRMNWVLELSGVGLILANALLLRQVAIRREQKLDRSEKVEHPDVSEPLES